MGLSTIPTYLSLLTIFYRADAPLRLIILHYCNIILFTPILLGHNLLTTPLATSVLWSYELVQNMFALVRFFPGIL